MFAFTSNLSHFYDVPDQMVHDLWRRAEVHFRRQEDERRAVTTVATFEAEQRRVRDAFLDAIGGLPEVRTPLQVQCTGALQGDAYTIEKIVYQSLPEFYVTANLYVPEGLTEPAPAILFVCGHSESGKAAPLYQAVCADLAHNGFVVLAMDPTGQGERFQYLDPDTGQRIVGGCCAEHNYTGLQYTLAGANIARQFIWDGIRGVDYLESRPEVDPTRIGITGNSGGGTQTCLLMMSEPRLAAGAPCCFVMTLESWMRTNQTQDDEQVIRGCYAWGPDLYQYLTAMAPKPVQVGAALYDYFPVEGAQETVRRAREIYALYGAPDKVGIAYSPRRHGFSPELRQAVVNWMRVHLKDEPGDFRTGDPATLTDAEIACTPTGQVLTSYSQARTIFDLNVDYLDRRGRPMPSTDPDALRRTLAKVLGIAGERQDYPINPRIVQDGVIEGYPTEQVFFFSGPDVIVAGIVLHPRGTGPARQADLVLLERGTEGHEAPAPAPRAPPGR